MGLLSRSLFTHLIVADTLKGWCAVRTLQEMVGRGSLSRSLFARLIVADTLKGWCAVRTLQEMVGGGSLSHSLFARLIALALSKAGAQCAPYKCTKSRFVVSRKGSLRISNLKGRAKGIL